MTELQLGCGPPKILAPCFINSSRLGNVIFRATSFCSAALQQKKRKLLIQKDLGQQLDYTQAK